MRSVLSSAQERELLADFKRSDRDTAIHDQVQLLCTRWTTATNGDSPGPQELTNLLYDIGLLSVEKQAVCKKALLGAGIFKNASALDKRLKSFSPVKESKPESEAPTFCARFEGLVDLVIDNGVIKFLIKNRSGELSVIDHALGNGKKLIPPPAEQIPFRLARWEKVKSAYETDNPSTLFSDLVSYHSRISKLPSDNHLVLLAAWDFSTYRQEVLPYSGYLAFFNVAGRGKTRTGTGLINVAYRGVHTITLREANLFRASNDVGATVFLDVMDLSKKLEKCDSEDILLQRFQKGARVSRVLYPEKGAFKDTVYYDIFGPTVIATNRELNKILDTRCFPISMPHAGGHFPDPDPAEGLAFRERLVAYRAQKLFEPLESPGKIMSGRLGDISMPLRSILQEVKPEAIPAFDQLITEIQEANSDDKSESLEGRVIRTVHQLLPEALDSKLPISRITEKINAGLSDESDRYISSWTVGRILKALGFKKARSNRERFICLEHDDFKTMIQDYGLQNLEAIPEKPSPVSHLSLSDVDEKVTV